MLFTLQDTVLILEHFTRSGGAILGKPNQKGSFLELTIIICVPDVWIVLVNVFMNLGLPQQPLLGQTDTETARQLPLNGAKKR